MAVAKKSANAALKEKETNTRGTKTLRQEDASPQPPARPKPADESTDAPPAAVNGSAPASSPQAHTLTAGEGPQATAPRVEAMSLEDLVKGLTNQISTLAKAVSEQQQQLAQLNAQRVPTQVGDQAQTTTSANPTTASAEAFQNMSNLVVDVSQSLSGLTVGDAASNSKKELVKTIKEALGIPGICTLKCPDNVLQNVIQYQSGFWANYCQHAFTNSSYKEQLHQLKVSGCNWSQTDPTNAVIFNKVYAMTVWHVTLRCYLAFTVFSLSYIARPDHLYANKEFVSEIEKKAKMIEALCLSQGASIAVMTGLTNPSMAKLFESLHGWEQSSDGKQSGRGRGRGNGRNGRGGARQGGRGKQNQNKKKVDDAADEDDAPPKSGQRKCFQCKSPDHVKKDCPEAKKKKEGE